MIFYCYDSLIPTKNSVSVGLKRLLEVTFTPCCISWRSFFSTRIPSLYHKQTENGFTNDQEFVNHLENYLKSSFSLIHSLCYATMDINRFGTIQNPTYRIFKE